MKSIRNWNTTLVGFAAGVLNLVANGMSWQAALFSTALALLGAVAKDGGKGSAP